MSRMSLIEKKVAIDYMVILLFLKKEKDSMKLCVSLFLQKGTGKINQKVIKLASTTYGW